MTTARTVIKGSLRLLRVIAAEEDPQAVATTDGLEVLNQMLHGLKAQDADVDYQNITLDEDIPLPPEHIRPVRYMLAAELAPEYGVQLTPEVAVEARDARQILQASYHSVGRLYPDDAIQDRIGRYGYNINTDT